MKVPYRLAILLNKIQEAGCASMRREGDEFRCRCPAHDDNGPSLYVAVTEDKILLNCKGGCSAEAVCNSLDHDVNDLFFDGDEPWVDLEEELAPADIATGPPVLPQPVVLAGTEDLRDSIYVQLLDHLELTTTHFEDLRRRGLLSEEIAKRGYRSADIGKLFKAIDELLQAYGRDRLLTVPGFQDRNGRVVFTSTQGLLIPVRYLTGRIVAIKVRHDAGGNGPKYSWASAKEVSCGNPVHVPLGVPAPSTSVRLTEGELKADVATALSGVPTISAPGVASWPQAVPVLRELGVQSVLLAFDQDGKPGTLASMEKALYGLTREGFDVSLEWWDGALAKGIDDLLAGGGRPEVVRGLAAAVRVQVTLALPTTEVVEAEEPEPAPWPEGVFPPALDAFLHEVAAATDSPPDFAGVTMLVTAGAAIGTSRAVCLKEHVWYEAPRMFAAIVGDPGSSKTPGMDAVINPYQAAQVRLLTEYERNKANFEQARAEYDQVLRENRALPAEERQPLPSVPEEPAEPERFVVVDATIESLAPLLARNPRGLLMPQDEGVGWVRGMGQYKGGRGNDRQFWLSAWSGKSHFVDRKSNGLVPLSIPRPFINVVTGIQPDMLGELADRQGRNDGFLHRILFSFPKGTGGTSWTEITVSQRSKDTWAATLASLRKLAMKELDDGVLGYQVVRLSSDAKEAWVRWWDTHTAEMHSQDLPAQLIGPWSKLKSYTARLALVLHYLWLVQTDGDDGDLDAASVERAIRLIDYFKSHLRIVYGRLRQTPEENQVLEVLDWVRRHGGRCTARHLVRSKKVSDTTKAKKMLHELAERGYGRLDMLDAANGRKVQWFVFAPG
jgi:hypothetical protein